MIDELSLGLAPIIVEQLLELVREINAQGTTVILVEQSVNLALTIANTAYFMEKGEIRFSGPTHDLLERPDLLRSVFLEGAAAAHEPAKVAAKLAHEPIAAAGANGSVKRDVALEIVGLDKAFGGRKVIQSVSFQLHEGEILGIIGPNGAGKTTLFDLISGFLDPDAGDILLGGERVNDLRPDQRVHHGLGRSFQDARLFGALTADETMKVALDRLLEVRDPLAAALGLPDVADAERRIEVLAASLAQRTGVSDFRDKYIAELSTGSRRIVDIACQLGLEPKVLLFDEPSSGIAQRETEALGPMLRRIRDTTGASLIVIEHDMPLIASVSDRLIALDLGRVVCDGGVRTVLNHPEVVASYLGTSPEVIARSGDVAERRPSPPKRPARTRPLKAR
jgi:branched-chain amino acid transport system ATP-binding protein